MGLLKQTGVNEQELQKLVNSGAIQQINKQGKVDMRLLRQTGVNEQTLQELVNSGALQQIAEQGRVDIIRSLLKVIVMFATLKRKGRLMKI